MNQKKIIPIIPGEKIGLAGDQTSKGVSAFLDSMRHPGEDDPLDGPQEIIPGIISEGQTALFPGPPGSGKSFVIVDLLARVAKDLLFLDQPVMHGGVVYVTGEGQGGLAKRISALINELNLEATSPYFGAPYLSSNGLLTRRVRNSLPHK